jgi:hypothetical protein
MLRPEIGVRAGGEPELAGWLPVTRSEAEDGVTDAVDRAVLKVFACHFELRITL